ncbi:hypothetical protein ACFQ9X_47395 [Catenulispora yoronensis]
MITDGGHVTADSAANRTGLYCEGSRPDTTFVSDLTQGVPGGSGFLVVGTARARVAKIVAHLQGVAAPVTVTTVPAPGVDRSIYVLPVAAGTVPDIDFDLYDASGRKIGSADNHSMPPNLPSNQDS